MHSGNILDMYAIVSIISHDIFCTALCQSAITNVKYGQTNIMLNKKYFFTQHVHYIRILAKPQLEPHQLLSVKKTSTAKSSLKIVHVFFLCGLSNSSLLR